MLKPRLCSLMAISVICSGLGGCIQVRSPVTSCLQLADNAVSLSSQPSAFASSQVTSQGVKGSNTRYMYSEIMPGRQHSRRVQLTGAQLEDVQKQFYAADILYQQVLGLSAALTTPRYQNANFMHIIFVPSEKSFGLTYDEITTTPRHQHDGCYVSVRLSDQVRAPVNPTPAHELFHVYQNSQSMFKQAWYSEGTARWSESMVSIGTGAAADRLPQTARELQQWMRESYGASRVWIRLFSLVDTQSRFAIPMSLQSLRYSDGRPVVADDRAYGVRFMRLLMQNLSNTSDQIARQEGWSRFGWPEAEQKDPRFNAVIWQAVQQTVNTLVPPHRQPDELRRFVNLQLP